MNKKQREYINEYLYRKLLGIVTESDDAENLTSAIEDRIVRDIEECADENWNSSDIDIAFSRLLKDTFLKD